MKKLSYLLTLIISFVTSLFAGTTASACACGDAMPYKDAKYYKDSKAYSYKDTKPYVQVYSTPKSQRDLTVYVDGIPRDSKVYKDTKPYVDTKPYTGKSYKETPVYKDVKSY